MSDHAHLHTCVFFEGHKWSDNETKILWSLVKDFQDSLYHGKGNLTHPQVVSKITTIFSKCSTNPPPTLLGFVCIVMLCPLQFADTKTSSALDRKQIDNKIRQIERCFRGREVNRASGSADLHAWEMETQVAPVLGLFCALFVLHPPPQHGQSMLTVLIFYIICLVRRSAYDPTADDFIFDDAT